MGDRVAYTPLLASEGCDGIQTGYITESYDQGLVALDFGSDLPAALLIAPVSQNSDIPETGAELLAMIRV